MKTAKVLLLFALVAAPCAFAEPVAPSVARYAAACWAVSDAALGVPHGTSASGITAYAVDGTTGFYAVSLSGGGMVFISADDEIGPVLAFTSESSPDLSEKSPLLNLLRRDVAARRVILKAEAAAAGAAAANPASGGAVAYTAQASSSSTSGTSASPSAVKAKKLWTAFAGDSSSQNAAQTGAPVKYGASGTAAPKDTMSSSDIRVDPILTSKWSQQTAAGQPCYNYYTPNNYPCGCVATAAGQILYKWKWPTETKPPFANSCSVDGATVTLYSANYPNYRQYDWDSMVPVPDNGISETGRQAIGALLNDLGVAFGAEYTYSGTGAYEFNVPSPLRSKFGFASAWTYTVNGTSSISDPGLHKEALRQKAVLANLDAGRPVELYIISSEAGGHAVVADGYGYVQTSGEAVEYTHINMGWAGTDDLWYNLPVIQTREAGAAAGQTGGYTFEILMGATFNIHPTETGDLLTGRILDDEDPVEGATVVAYAAGSATVVATTNTNARGVYAFCLPGGVSYDIVATSSDGKKTGTLEAVALAKTVDDSTMDESWASSSESSIGNSWGNDIDIAIPYVRIDETLYPNLDRALFAAMEMEDDATIEIFGPVRLKNAITVTKDVAIVTVPDETSDYPSLSDCTVSATANAMTTDGWALQVADGIRVSVSNFLFVADGGGTPPGIDVLAGGVLALSGAVGAGTVSTYDDAGIALAGPLEAAGNGVCVAASAASARAAVFGTWECDADTAAACASQIANASDGSLLGSAQDDGTLVWERVSVPASVAIAAVPGGEPYGSTTNYYRSLDILFEDFPDGAEIVLLKDCDSSMCSGSPTLSGAFSIFSSDDVQRTVAVGKSSTISISSGGSLAVSNVVFTREGSTASTKHLFHLKGGSLTLDSGAEIADLKLSGTACAVYVYSGAVAMSEGSSITNCAATTTASTQTGPAIFLRGSGCSLSMSGGQVAGCRCGKAVSGAIHAASGSSVSISGHARVCGNVFATDTSKDRNLYVASSSILSVDERLSGKVGVYCYTGYKTGKSFAAVGDGLSEADALSSEGAFSNDIYASLVAKVSGSVFSWAEAPADAVRETDADDAVAIVLRPDGVEKCYASVDDAFAVATNSSQTITLARDAVLSNSLAAAEGTEILFNGGGFALTRSADAAICVTNASFAATNAVFDGGTGEGRMFDVYCGSLALRDGAVVSNVCGSAQSMVAAIVVWGGEFSMEDGSSVVCCTNSYPRSSGNSIAAGAVAVSGFGSTSASANLSGGEIRRCAGALAGGVFAGNLATVSIQGGTTVAGNSGLSGENLNIAVQDNAVLVLSGSFNGAAGCVASTGAASNIFGRVAADLLADETADAIAAYAWAFTRDSDGARGLVATNATGAILVWNAALSEGDSVTATDGDGETSIYIVAAPGGGEDDAQIVVCESFGFISIEKSADGLKWILTLAPGTEHCTYTLYASDDLATWTESGDAKTLEADDIGDDGEFSLEADAGEDARFWYVKGADGTL